MSNTAEKNESLRLLNEENFTSLCGNNLLVIKVWRTALDWTKKEPAYEAEDKYLFSKQKNGRSQWPRKSAAAFLLGLRVRISPMAWMTISYVCCVLSGRGLYHAIITRPGESYRVWCV